MGRLRARTLNETIPRTAGNSPGRKKGTHGGYRAGAGRKLGVANVRTQELQDILDANVDFNVVVGKLCQLADGILIEETKRGEEIIYRVPPDGGAIKTLLEFRFGRAPQQIGISGSVDVHRFNEYSDDEVKAMAARFAKIKDDKPEGE